ncbi:hypothetical protein Lal_00046521 [Lupinus albus]|nr:hypothetical protein Lal_00046521 [Lupinus albus]
MKGHRAPKPSVQIRPHMNTRQFRGIRNNPSRHCEARQAPQQRTLFRGTGNRGHVADGLNHKRAMASTMFNHVQPPKVHFRMLGNLPLRATAMPIRATPSATSFRAERVTREASARPRDAHNYPSRHCEARPAPQQSTHFRGTRRLQRRC